MAAGSGAPYGPGMPLPRRASRPLAAALAGVAALAALVAPAGPAAAAPFPGTVPLPAGRAPEGIANGPGVTFYAGSRADGSIYRGNLRTGEGRVLVPGVEGRIAVGMKYDDATGRLWVAGGTTGAVTAYDGRTGRQLGRWVVPGSGFLNDVEVTPDAVYVTDSAVQRLVVVPLGTGGALPGPRGARTLPLTGDIEWDPQDFNANGIRALPGGRNLVIVQSSTGKLFRVPKDTGRTDEIELSGPALSSGDGLVLRGSTLYVVYGFATDAVAVVQLGRHNLTGRVTGRVGDPDLDRPTTAIIEQGALWAVNGRFSVTPTPTTPYDVVRVALPAGG